MLASEAVDLSIKIAKGLIKLVNRVDKLLAEKAAVTSAIALPQKVMKLGPRQGPMIRALKKLLADEPDLPKADRTRISKVLESNNGNPATSALRKLMDVYLPEQALGRIFDLDEEFVQLLRKSGVHVDDPDVRVSLFYLKAELTADEKGYPWRIALTVVDVLAEFGAENQALFVRDQKIQGLVGAVLKRFGETDLQTEPTWGGLLRKAISATLNGALDAKEIVDTDNKLVGTVLDGLVTARNRMPKGERDNFLLGLLQGEGYPVLVSTLLETGANALGDEDASAFESVAADVLKQGASLLKDDPSFEEFFRRHWGDLLRAGFTSLKEHGPVLSGNKPLVGDIVSAIAETLSETEDRDFLTSDTLVSIVDTAIGVVAANPKLLKAAPRNEFLGELVFSVVETVADQGVRTTFSRDGAAAIVKRALATFGEHPDLIVDQPGLVQELVGNVLEKLSGVERLTATELASAAVEGALTAVAENPHLLPLKYPEVVADFAAKVAELVEESQLTGIQGRDILLVLTRSVAENPTLLGDPERKLAESVLGAVVRLSDNSKAGLLTGPALARTVEQIVSALGRYGRAKFGDGPLEPAIEQLDLLLEAGLARAEEEIGTRMGVSFVPIALGRLVGAWARDEVGELDPNNPHFKRLFGEFATQAAA